MRLLLLYLTIVLAAAATAPLAAAQAPPFDWSMPERLGPENSDGLLEYPGSAAEFEEEEARRKGFTVELSVRQDLCRKDVTYTWSSEAGVASGRGRAGCSVSQEFPSEGEHPVSLRLLFPGGKTLRFDRKVTVQDWLIVSIGDSVASGEGNPDVPAKLGRRAKWESSRCHRSAKAGPAVAALGLEAADSQTSTTFVHLACSGAEVDTGLLQGYRGIDAGKHAEPPLLPPQVAELKRIASVRPVDAVLLSVGANDVYFGQVVAFCIRKWKCFKKDFSPEGDPSPPRPLEEAVGDALTRLPARYETLAGELEGVVPPERVLVVDYFDPTKDEHGETCKGIIGGQITEAEAQWAATHLLEPLNAIVGKAADDAGWTEVRGVAEAFRTHGYCAQESWIRHLGTSFFKQRGETFGSRLKGTLHPNELGHLQEGEMIGLSLAGVLYGGPLAGAGSDRVVVTVKDEKGEVKDDEAPLEDTALIGLLAAAVVSALAGAVAFAARRRRGEPWAQEARKPEKDIPGRPPVQPGAESVAAFAALVEDPGRWVHRRVESIEIVDERTVRRRVSVDFTPEPPPGLSAPTHAPIALLSKRVLSRFDLRDEAGDSVPLATSEQNAAFAAAHMLLIAEEVTEREPSRRLRYLCWRIARGTPAQAKAAIRQIASDLEPAEREALKESERFRSATETFASNFAVLVEVKGRVRRRVIKLAYDQMVRSALSWRQRLGLAPVLTAIEIPELGDAASRHFEFVRSEGLETLEVQLLAVRPDGEIVLEEGSADGTEAHLAAVRMPRETRGLAGVFLRAARSGILVGGPPLAGLSALTLTLTWFALPGIAGDSSSPAASILLAVPVAFGIYLGSRASHPLEAAMLWGARALVFLSGVLAFLSAGVLALGASVGVLRIVLGIAAAASWLITAGLLVILFSPKPNPAYDRREVH